MENHPIPQDVTGFKFKLIGNVTIKQFLYLLLFGFFAWVAFSLPIFFLFKFPFVLFFIFLGIGLAFVPIEGRPMDKMLYNFLKAIPAENQYIYRKTGALSFFEELQRVKPSVPTQASTPPKKVDYAQAKKALLYNQLKSTQSTQPAFEKKELDLLNSVKTFFDESTFKNVNNKVDVASSSMKPITSSEKQDAKKESLKGEMPILQPLQVSSLELAELGGNPLQPLTTQVKTEPTASEIDQKLKEMQAELMKTLQEKDNLQKKLFEISRQKPEEVFRPKEAEGFQEKPQETQYAHTISAQNTVSSGFPTLPDIPNILLGIIKDPRGKVLQNILVEVMDKNDIPVRAFKTNALGQFISATPLPDGVYHIRLEDSQKNHEFDKLEVTLNGTIFQPIEIESIDQRERLRRELFGE